ALECAFHQVADEFFLEAHVVFRVVPRDLRLAHPEFVEMPARLRLLRPERGSEAVDLAERGRSGLDVELPRLGEEGALAEVVRLEEAARRLADRAGEDRRVDADEAPLMIEIVDRLLDLRAHAQDRALLAGAQPEV